jgi:hypothetical protein
MDRTDLLDRFRTGYDDVGDALAGITPDQLDRRPPDGGWSAREIAHHLPDSDATAYVRLRRLIAEDNPTIVGYDEASSCLSNSRSKTGSAPARTPSRATTRSTTGCATTPAIRTTTPARSVAPAGARRSPLHTAVQVQSHSGLEPTSAT